MQAIGQAAGGKGQNHQSVLSSRGVKIMSSQ